MQITEKHNQKIAKLTFAEIYPLYIAKIEKKGRTVDELNEIITWLTGFSELKIKILIDREVTFEEFFKEANLNSNAIKITGMICGYRIEEIENELTRRIRYLDKIVDELAMGKSLDKIMRT